MIITLYQSGCRRGHAADQWNSFLGTLKVLLTKIAIETRGNYLFGSNPNYLFVVLDEVRHKRHDSDTERQKSNKVLESKT